MRPGEYQRCVRCGFPVRSVHELATLALDYDRELFIRTGKRGSSLGFLIGSLREIIASDAGLCLTCGKRPDAGEYTRPATDPEPGVHERQTVRP